MPVTHKKTFTFAPLVIEYIGDKIETNKITGHSKAIPDLVIGDLVDVSDLTIVGVHDEDEMDPADMAAQMRTHWPR